MPTLLILGGLGAVALYLYSQSSSPAAAGPGQYVTNPPPGFQGAPGQFSATTSPGYSGSNPGNYPVVPNGTTPGQPAASTSTSGPLYHTGWSDASCGAPIVQDGHGNPYLMA